MVLSICRRHLLAGAVAGTAALLPSRSHSYGDYFATRVMRPPALEDGEAV